MQKIMLKHIHKFIPWKTEKQKKEKFLDKLKGTLRFKIRTGVPVGAMFIVSNNSSGRVDTYYYTADNTWVRWGTDNPRDGKLTQIFTNRQLEVYLTSLVQEANWENAISLIDECCCLEWIEPK